MDCHDSTTSAPDVKPATPDARTQFVRAVKAVDAQASFFGSPAIECQYQPHFDAISLRDQSGYLLTHEEAEELIEEVQAFYSRCSPEDVEEYNARRREAERNRPYRVYSPPKKTDAGFVYLLRSEHGHYKIGRAKNVRNRHQMIGTKMPFKVDLIHTIACEDYINAERMMHAAFAEKRLNGEWFALTDEDVKVITCVESLTAEEVAE